jgi:hypothetical protein
MRTLSTNRKFKGRTLKVNGYKLLDKMAETEGRIISF